MPPCGRLSFRGPVGGAVQTKAGPPGPARSRGDPGPAAGESCRRARRRALDEAALDEAGAESAASVFAYRPGHRWWYFPAMHAGEALIIKLHDTDHSVAWRAPHTSFRDASAAGASPRQSIELRSVAYFY